MNKTEYIEKLRALLEGCPKEEVERFLSYYGEMIDDRIEDGCPEDEACLSFGSIEDVAAQIRQEILLPEEDAAETVLSEESSSEKTAEQEPARPVKQVGTEDGGSADGSEASQENAAESSAKTDTDKKSVNVFLLILAIIGFPLWFPLCIAAFVILFAFLICLWAVVLASWCVFVSLAAAAVASIPGSILLLFYEGIGGFLIEFGCAFICAALAIVFLWLSLLLIKGCAKLTALPFKGLWRLLVRK